MTWASKYLPTFRLSMAKDRAEGEVPGRFPGIIRWRSLSTSERIADVVAGLIIAALLVPQAMAYAGLAGLPPQMGLYSAVLPLLAYALFGSSRVVSMGPMALSALLVGSTLQHSGLAPSQLTAAASTLALLVGGWLLLFYALRLGRLIDFVSPAVMQGFTVASALMIMLSQMGDWLGLEGARGDLIDQLVGLWQQLPELNIGIALVGVVALLLLWMVKRWLPTALLALKVPSTVAQLLGRCGPAILMVLAIAAMQVWALPMAKVGSIPAGLPSLALPLLSWSAVSALLLPALGIALVNYVSAVSVSEALAARSREATYPLRELWVLGLCNLLAALSRGFPVTSGLGRAAVSETAGARTPLSSLFSALALIAVMAWLTGLFVDLPRAVLAAIVIQAAAGLMSFSSLVSCWRYSRADACAWLAAFAGVLLFGVMPGLGVGVGLSLALLLARNSKPYIDEIGRLPEGGFRNPERFQVDIPAHLLMVRPGSDLNFANMGALERFVNTHLAQRRDVEHVVLVMSGVLYIDGAALGALERLDDRLHGQGITLWLAELRAPVRDQLSSTAFQTSHQSRTFFSAEEAWQYFAVRRSLSY
ncbi:putative sulfate transporter [Carnimonas sp. LMG 33810]